MPDTPSIVINKQLPYRGNPEIYSNKYHFSGTTPSDQAGWEALATAIWNVERTFIKSDIKYAGFLGYEAGNDHAVAMRDYVAEGGTLSAGATASGGGGDLPPGDVAATIRWRTPDRTSRGKTIYLRKYFHGVMHSGDNVDATSLTALTAYGAKMIDGSLPGGFKVCGPQGAVASVPVANKWMTTRTLKRRGRRPH